MIKHWMENQDESAGACSPSDGALSQTVQRTMPPEGRESVLSFRFVPAAYLATCGSKLDGGAERLIYLQSLINEDI